MASKQRMKEFMQARYGMFIHFGAYSMYGKDAWVMFNEGLDVEEYKASVCNFRPDKFDAKELVSLAKNSGMKYMVFGTKHHDGFCLFDSQYTDFNCVKNGFGRDLVREYVDECRRQGLMVGLYFSLRDWTFPVYFKGKKGNEKEWAKYVEFTHNQVKELLTNYGKIDIFFFDGCDDANITNWDGMNPKEAFDGEKLLDEMRNIQSDIIINDRSGYGGDYCTPEQIIHGGVDKNKYYESCMTLNNTWGYTKGDNFWKSPRDVLFHLVACASRGSNFLLNVGPKADGSIPNEYFESLLPVGRWLTRYGESIYGTDVQLDNYWDFHSSGRMTTKENTVYGIMFYYYDDGHYKTGYLDNDVISAELLGSDVKLDITKKGRCIDISNLPKYSTDELACVLKLKLSAPPKANKYY